MSFDAIIDAIMKFTGMFSPATWFLMLSLVIFIVLIARSSISQSNELNWEDMLLDQTTGKMSITRLGQFVGIIIGSWVVIAIVDSKNDIGIEVFGTYLAFLLGGYGVNSYFKNQPGGQLPPPPDDKPKKTIGEE